MVTVSDSGCHNHQPCQITFSGASAWMVERLIDNLPMNKGEFTYICEHGHTHHAIPFPAKQKTVVNLYGMANLPRRCSSISWPDCQTWKINLRWAL